VSLLAVSVLAVSGCGPCTDWEIVIGGKIKLAREDVDAGDFTSLEIRVYTDAANTEPIFIDTVTPVPAKIRSEPWAYEYVLTDEPLGEVVQVRAWLAREPGLPGPARGEPYGKLTDRCCLYFNVRLADVIE
jgi:hypothetical protein